MTGAAMTFDDRLTLQHYVLELARLLGLDHWTFVFELREPDGDTTLAETHIRTDGNVATMRFTSRIRQESDDEVRQTVVHELLHCHTDRFADDMADALERATPASTWETLHELHRRAYERMVDGIAAAIANNYPPIDWPAAAS